MRDQKSTNNPRLFEKSKYSINLKVNWHLIKQSNLSTNKLAQDTIR
jgi:hypothetical protein